MLSVRTIVAAALCSAVSAQTFTSCNPMEKDCPANPGLQAANFATDFTAGAAANWVSAAGTYLNYGANGAEFTISRKGNAPTIQSDFYIFFGRVEATLRASPGAGIVSSVVLLSDDLDEVDWEWLGGKDGEVQSNYYGKGNTTTYDRVAYHPVSAATTTYHTYAIDWTPEKITWYIDGNLVRTLNYADANGGKNFPQTPCRVSFGSWAAGATDSQGTVEWSGGPTDFSQGPFTMYLKNAKITNYNPADSYAFTDRSGSYQSIKLVGGGEAPAGPSSSTPSAAPAPSSTTANGTPSSSSVISTTVDPTASETVTMVPTPTTSLPVVTASRDPHNNGTATTLTSTTSSRVTSAGSNATEAPPSAAVSVSAKGAISLAIALAGLAFSVEFF